MSQREKWKKQEPKKLGIAGYAAESDVWHHVRTFLEPEKDLIEREETLFKNEKKYKDGIALH